MKRKGLNMQCPRYNLSSVPCLNLSTPKFTFQVVSRTIQNNLLGELGDLEKK